MISIYYLGISAMITKFYCFYPYHTKCYLDQKLWKFVGQMLNQYFWEFCHCHYSVLNLFIIVHEFVGH